MCLSTVRAHGWHKTSHYPQSTMRQLR